MMVGTSLYSQDNDNVPIVSYFDDDDYVIGGITVSGIKYLDSNAIIGVSGLREGQRVTIPGDVITNATRKLWTQGLFSDVRISILEQRFDTVFLDIMLQERPRLSSVSFNGIRTGEKEDIEEKINLKIGSQVTSYILDNTIRIIKNHFIEKGFLNTTVEVIQKDDTSLGNNVSLTFNVDKQEKVKIGELTFVGNESFDAKKLRRQMKGTKMKNLNFFKASKYINEKYDEDKAALTTFYNDNGFKDFEILSDSMYTISPDRIGLKLNVSEGDQYFLRDVKWVGNSVYRAEDLTRVFNVEKGSVYNQSLILDRLRGESGAEDAVSNLYLDYGYLFSSLTPVEAKVEADSVDLEVRIYEGDQAYVNDVIITGNTRTNEHVARRELYTLPGDLFSKDKIMRSIRQLGVLGHWDPEKISPMPLSDPINGTVDLLYQLEEKANDQFEISGGWGAGMLIGTIGVSFNNFAVNKLFDPKAWRPYPSGDGQSLSIRAQSNGSIYQSYNISFSDPWFGGKKPNSFTVSTYMSRLTYGDKGEDGYQLMNIYGGAVGLGKRLAWPDDYFSIYGELSYQRYDLQNYTYYSFLFENGNSNLFSILGRIQRYSVGPNVIYPRSGSTYSLSVQITPPYSVLSGKSYAGVSDQERYKWIEFHKWLFKAENYFPLTKDDKLVLSARFNFGYIGHYNKDIGPSPFEYFYLGGDGMSGYSFYGRDVIAMRGYSAGALTPIVTNSQGTQVQMGNVYSKITFEIRYPITLNQQATIYGLAFLETGKAWTTLKEFNPFSMNRAAGVGLRANLPMFGMLGVDWGYGFDDPVSSNGEGGSQFHFVLGQQF